jgi:hypothetical protein
MKIYTNEKLVKRNGRIGQILLLAGLLVLGGGLVLNFRGPTMFNYSLIAFLVGFLISQVGLYYANRWSRRPRPDEHLNTALKGLDGRYSLYHYQTPASHVLVGPAGVWALFPRYQRGVIVYEKGRWKQRGGGVFLAYLKLFAQEGLGRPDLEIASEVQELARFLSKQLPEEEIPPIQAALLFTDSRADVQVDNEKDNPPAVTLPIADLKETIRKAAKSKALSAPKVKALQDALEAVAR